ncbi:MAG TPA: MFS transporter [Pyrinomonadaceae bacterium]|nr:MFS transporter [Pyrinomonadaceae bacterium]
MSAAETSGGAGAGQVGIVELLRRNANFRRLWLGQVVSQLGDWFNTIALYTLVLELTGSGRAVGLVLVARFVPSVVLGPLAGTIADRFDRRAVMIVCDVGRAVVVLGFLLVRGAEDLWLVYALTAVQLTLSAFFEPAKSAAVPSVVAERELVTANTITSVTWSAMLTLGAAVGGVMTAAFGSTAAFALDSLTYLLSAVFVAAVRLPRRPPRERRKLTLGGALGLAETAEGAAYVRRRPRVMALLLVKPAWCVGGGILTLLAVFGERVFQLGGKTALGVSALYAARGVGTAVGPVVARRFFSGTRRQMEQTIGWSFVVAGLFYALFGLAPGLLLAAVFVAAAHLGGSILWGFSTVLLQGMVGDEFRGRVFAAEMMLLSLMLAASNYATGEALDRLGLSPRAVAVAVGLFFVVPGLVWLWAVRLWDGDRRGGTSDDI